MAICNVHCSACKSGNTLLLDPWEDLDLAIGAGPQQMNVDACGLRRCLDTFELAVDISPDYSITSSARAVNATGKVIPSAVAVFKLTAKSKRDDCRIGNSAAHSVILKVRRTPGCGAKILPVNPSNRKLRQAEWGLEVKLRGRNLEPRMAASLAQCTVEQAASGLTGKRCIPNIVWPAFFHTSRHHIGTSVWNSVPQRR